MKDSIPDNAVAISFEWSSSEQAVLVLHKFADGSREPFAFLYTLLQVDTFALQLEALDFAEGASDALRLVARNLDRR